MPGAFLHSGATGLLVLLVVALGGWALCVISEFRPGFALLFVAAVAIRVLPALSLPELSHDVYRYLWDGRVAAAGINPYAFAPADPRLMHLRTELHSRINHPEVRTIYPPAAQSLFGFVGFTGTGLAGWKALILLADLLTIGLISRWWGVRSAVMYGFFPLVIIEGAWNAHIDALATLVLLIAYGALARGRAGSAGVLLALAAMVKVVPAVALPAFVRHSERRWTIFAAFAGMILCITVPFVWNGGFMPGFGDFARRWSFNSPAYDAVSRFVQYTDVAGRLTARWSSLKDPLGLELISPTVYSLLNSEAVARAILGMAMLAGIYMVLRKSRTLASTVANSIGVLLLCSPVIHPWYWLALLPFAFRSRSALWILLAAASPFSYLLYEGGSQWIVLALCYGLPLAAVKFVAGGRPGWMWGSSPDGA